MFFDNAGVKLYYEKSGCGAPLLLLHGWGGRADSFLPVTRDFSAARTVYAVDFPGHGNSPEPPAPWSVTEYMELIWAFIRRMDISGCDIIAHSFGGRVALLLAAEHPEAVRRMVLTGCAGIKPPASGKETLRTRAYKVLRALADNGPYPPPDGENASMPGAKSWCRSSALPITGRFRRLCVPPSIASSPRTCAACFPG